MATGCDNLAFLTRNRRIFRFLFGFGALAQLVSTSAFADDQVGPQADYSEIDRLNLRGIVAVPKTADTLLGDMGGLKETLADYGIGFSALLAGNFETQISGLPHTTAGQQRYVGQQAEFDSSASYLALTYDLGRIGLKDGLFTMQGCGAYSTYAKTYPSGMRFCSAYIDQPLFNNVLDIQVGYLANNYQFANPLVGGSVASGSIGPSSSILTEMGLSAGGIGAPGVNVAVNLGDFYDKAGVQRSVSPQGYVYDGTVANTNGLSFNENGAGTLLINEVGYKHNSTADSDFTWVRLGAMQNNSSFTRYHGGTSGADGFYALADFQLFELDPKSPSRGIYAGASYMYANPQVFAYPDYYEGRIYAKGLFPDRPKDQLTFVATETKVSNDYQWSLEKKGEMARSEIYNFTLVYNYKIMPGLSLNGGFSYALHPSVYYTEDEGSPLLLRLSLAAYF